MSSYVCDDKTINRIVGGLFHAQHMGDFNRPYPRVSEKLLEVMGDDPAEFGRTLYAMNVNAVEQRYPDCVGNADNLPGKCDQDGHHVTYQYRLMGPADRIQFHKSLNCYLYQCSEGDVDELPLYNLLREYLNTLSNHIVTGSTQWQNSEWG